MGVKFLDPVDSFSVKWIDGIHLRHASALEQIYDTKIHDGFWIDLETRDAVKLHRFVPWNILHEQRAVHRFWTPSVLFFLSPPTVPTMKVRQRLPIRLMQEFQLEIQTIVAGMKAPAAFELSRVIHFQIAFVRVKK